jgi:CcmD family protein
MNALGYVGAAYAAIWILLLLYLWRLTSLAQKLAERVDELERELGPARRR